MFFSIVGHYHRWGHEHNWFWLWSISNAANWSCYKSHLSFAQSYLWSKLPQNLRRETGETKNAELCKRIFYLAMFCLLALCPKWVELRGKTLTAVYFIKSSDRFPLLESIIIVWSPGMNLQRTLTFGSNCDILHFEKQDHSASLS